MMKRGALAWLVLLVAILCSPFSLGIGLVYPTDYSGLVIPFEPLSEHTLEYRIRTNAGKTMDYELSAKGDLADYVRFNPPVLYDIPDGAMPSFKVILTLPQTISEPGYHTIEIKATEGSTRGEGGGMGVRTASTHEFKIFVPYPFLYSTFTLDAYNVNEGEPVHFLGKASNLGEKDIEKSSVVLSIYDSGYELVDTMSSETKFIPSQESADFEFQWEADGVKPGEYLASAVLTYDGKTAQSETHFKVGTLKVLVKDYTDTIESGRINRFDIVVSSLWNNPLDSVHADLTIPGIGGMNTPTVSIAPFGETILTAFVDAQGVDVGQLEGMIRVYYGDQVTEHPVLVEVIEPIAEPEPDTAEPDAQIAEQSGSMKGMLTLSNVLMLIIIILILVEVVYIFTHRRK